MKRSPNLLSLATAICEKLFAQGFTAYFAGGFVRDLLLGETSDEIDIATSASPDQVAALFSKTIPVGKQFGVMIVVEEGMQFEVTTFRKDHPYEDGRHPEGVDFSTPEKDASRRDFTINGMFYDPLTKEVLDYVGGREDLHKQQIRAIGEPLLRFQEDRLRMIRAVRFSARFGFALEKNTEAAIVTAASTLFPSVSIERVWQEFEKMARYPHFDRALLLLHKLGLLEVIFPQLWGTDISTFVASFPYFPLETPTILYLLQLFPQASVEERISLCHYLKLSKKTVQLVTFFSEMEALSDEAEPYVWAYYYAQPEITLYVEVKKATLPYEGRQAFVEKHEKRQEKLRVHIERLQNKRPLVTSEDLKGRGVEAGKRMGELLERAVRLSVNEDIHDKDELLRRMLS